MTAVYTAIIVAVIGLQSFWIKHALDTVGDRITRFETRNHADMQAHTEAITDLRERVARLEA